jgi:uncharacterized damage-inducible protein DinB
MTASLPQAFIDYSRAKLAGEYWPRLRTCVESLTDDQIWWRPNEAANSVGNLLLHLNGNVRQWLVTPFSDAIDQRNRPAEFGQRTLMPRAVLLRDLQGTIDDAMRVLGSLSAADLQKTLDIQGYTVTGLEAVYHVVEHFSYHYGQIVFVTKQLAGQDLGFYRALDATGRSAAEPS